MSTEPRSALERIRAADRALVDVGLDPRADARIRSRLPPGRRPYKARGRLALVATAVAVIGLAIALTRPRVTDIPPCEAGPAPSRCVVAWSQSRIIVEPGGHIETGPRSVRVARGRARFEVEPRAPGAAPFQVTAAGAVIEVLGTAFTVSARADGGDVVLHHGRVAVRTPAGRRTRVERPGETLRWSDLPEPPEPAKRPPPAPPTARRPEKTPPPPIEPATPAPGADAPEAVTAVRPSVQPAPETAPRAAATRERPPPATDAELARVVALRRDGRPRDALALVERLARRANSPAMAEALSIERGDLLGGPLGRRSAACTHWRRHAERYRHGPLRSAVDASVARLRCAMP